MIKEFSTLISGDRLQFIELYVFPLIESMEGGICEVGVYRGGSLARFAEKFPEKEIIGIDTFEGLPAPTEKDRVNDLGEFHGHNKGDFGDTDFGELKDLFAQKFTNVQLIKGFFPSKEIIEQIKDKTFSFVHIDVDLYESVLECCKYFYPKLPRKGVIVFDDYGFKSTPGAMAAVDEYFCDITRCIKRELRTKQYFVVRM